MFNKRNLFREKYGKMTDEQLEEYHAIVELAGEDAYWKDKLDGMLIRFVGILAMCFYILIAANPKVFVAVGILVAAWVVRQLTKLRVIEVDEIEEIE